MKVGSGFLRPPVTNAGLPRSKKLHSPPEMLPSCRWKSGLRQYLCVCTSCCVSICIFVLANLNSRADEKGEDELVSLEQTAANILVHEVGDVAHEDLKPSGEVRRLFAHLNAVIVQFFEVLERILRSSSGVSICIFVLVKQRS